MVSFVSSRLKKHSISLLLICLLGFFFSRTLFTAQLPRTDDGELHGARLANYYLALKQGQFPPRWAPNLNYGFGNPMFIFSYPLPYIGATVLYALGMSIELSWNMVVVGSIFSLALGWYCLSYFHLQSKKLSVILTCLLLTTPYYLVNIFVRGAMGEVVFAGLVPWVVLGYEYTLRNQGKLSIVLMSLLLILALLSHQVLGPFLLLFLICLSVIRGRKVIINFLPSVVLSVACTSFFYLPAFFENDRIRLMEDESVKNLERAFVPFTDIFWSSWNYGGKTGIEGEKFTRMIGPFFLIAIIIVIPKILQKKLKKNEMFLLTVIGLVIFLMTRYSLPVWNTFTLLRLMQFPWRLLQFGVLSSTLLLIYLLQDSPLDKTVKGVSVVFIFIWVSYVLVNWAKPVSYISNSNHDWLEYGKLGDASGEFLPKDFDQHKNYALTDQVFVGQIDSQTGKLSRHDGATVEVISWNGTNKQYHIKTDREVLVAEKTMFFPGRVIRVNSKEMAIEADNQFYPGRVVYSLPSGEHQIESIWTEKVTGRLLANNITVLGWLILLLLVLLPLKEGDKKRIALLNINS